MKVPPKRKGNLNECPEAFAKSHRLNESPSEKEGKFQVVVHTLVPLGVLASMKVPPKRKGNGSTRAVANRGHVCLNESPSEKEGKFECVVLDGEADGASMKVPPKRKGNDVTMTEGGNLTPPQ